MLRSTLLTAYLASVAERILPPHMALRSVGGVSAHAQIAGRDHRIMVGDYLEWRKSGTKADGKPVLCKCVGIAEFMRRRRVQDWQEGRWAREHVVFGGDESDYRVITEAVARKLDPTAFAQPNSPPKEVL